MYEFAKYEFNKWLKEEKWEQLQPYQKTMVSILAEHFEDIAAQGTAHGNRAKLISQYIKELYQQCIIDCPYVSSELQTSNAIQKLVSLQVERFRGFGAPIEFTFNKQYSIFHGTNGSGKTSMCEALEYSVLGTIEEATSRNIPLNKYILHSGERKASIPRLVCRFTDGSEAVCDADMGRYRFAFIEKNRIDAFSHIGAVSPKNQLERIAALFGLTEFQSYVSGFTEELDQRYIKLSTSTDKDIEEKKKAILQREKQIEQNSSRLQVVEEELGQIIRSLGKKEVTTPEAAINYLSNPENGVYTTLLKEYNDRKMTQINTSDIDQLKSLTERYLSLITALREDISKILGSIAEVDLLEFYQSLKELEKTWKEDYCPACHTPLDKAKRNPYLVASEEIDRLNEIESAKKSATNHGEQLAACTNQIQHMMRKKEIQSLFSHLGVTAFVSQNYPADIFEVADHRESECTKVIESVHRELENSTAISSKVAEYNAIAEESNSKYNAKLQKLQSLQKSISEKAGSIKTLRRQIEEDKKASAESKKELEKLVSGAEQERTEVEFNVNMANAYHSIITSIKSFASRLPAEMARDLSKSVVNYYNMINEGDAEFELISELSLPVESGDKILIKMQDGITQDALQLLSEGHVRILGLSILLAKANQAGVPFLIFDDIVNAIDDDHRLGVAKLLIEHPDFESTQMILTCHGETFVSWIDDLIADEKKVARYRFLPADSLEARGIVIKYDDATIPLRTAREKYNANELKDCAAKCRQAVECITSKLWKRVVPYISGGIQVQLRKLGSAPDLYNTTTALKTVTKPGKYLQGTEDINSCLDLLIASSMWSLLNKGTHEDEQTPEFSRVEIKKLLELVEQLSEAVNSMRVKATNTPRP